MTLTPFPRNRLGNSIDFMDFHDAVDDDTIRTFEEIFLSSETADRREGTENAGGIPDPEVRQCNISFLQYDSACEKKEFVFSRLLELTQNINDHYFGFDLVGFEQVQYTIYGEGGDHYSWHHDKFNMPLDDNVATIYPRKLSFSLILSDSSEYEGGEFQYMSCGSTMEPQQEKGAIFVFPSWVNHAVKPVTSGLRKSLVWWVLGPPFK